MTHQSPKETKNVILCSDINKTIYHPTVGKLGMTYCVVIILTTKKKLFCIVTNW